MNRRNQIYCTAIVRMTCLACLIGDVTAALAQHPNEPPAAERWRPADGLYAQPDAKFNASCSEYGDVTVQLNEKHISGNEWGCDIVKLTDTSPSAIRLDMTCSDYNLAENLKLPEDKVFKEVMYLRKIDEHSMFVRKSINGKLGGSGWRAAYCPEPSQRAYKDQMAKEKEEAVQKAEWERTAAEERKAIEARKAAQEPSQPKDAK